LGILESETKYYVSRYNLFNIDVKARTMFKKTKPCEEISSNQQAEAKKRMEAVLQGIRALKSRTTELRIKIEELQKNTS
jgi:hypothetical protein